MKKMLSIILALAMTMTLLAGCGGSTADSDVDNTSNDSATNSTTDSSTTAESNQAEVDYDAEPDGIVAGSYVTYYATADTVSTQLPGGYAGGRWLYSWIYDTVFWSPSGDWTDMTGLLATSWSCSDDGLVWTFELTDEAYFLNGNPIDAYAVMRCFDYYIEKAQITNYDSYVALDDYTVEVTLTAPTSEFMQNLATTHNSIFDVQAWEENTAAGMDTMEAFVGIGSGPYYISDYELGASLTFTANADYWCEDRYPHIETIYSPVVTDASTQQTMLQSGDADLGIVSDWSVLENLVDNYGINYTLESGTYRTLWFNTGGYSECLTDATVREALTMMVDFDEVSIALSGAYGGEGFNAFNSGVDYVHTYTYDPEAGLALLATTDYEPSDIVLTAICDTAQSPIYSNVQAQLAECGITLNFSASDHSAVLSDGMAGLWDLWGENGGLVTGTYATQITGLLGEGSTKRMVQDPVLEPIILQMVTDAFATSDADESLEMLVDICAICAENYLYLGNIMSPTWYMYNDSIVNFVPDVNAKYWRAWDAWVAY